MQNVVRCIIINGYLFEYIFLDLLGVMHWTKLKDGLYVVDPKHHRVWRQHLKEKHGS